MMSFENINIDNFEKIVLEKVTFGLSVYLGEYTIQSLDVSIVSDILSQMLIGEMHGYLLGKKQKPYPIKTIWRPKTWWDAFKEQWFPEFLKSRFPVEYEAIVTLLQVYKICPHLDIPYNKDWGVHITFLQHKGGEKE